MIFLIFILVSFFLKLKLCAIPLFIKDNYLSSVIENMYNVVGIKKKKYQLNLPSLKIRLTIMKSLVKNINPVIGYIVVMRG